MAASLIEDCHVEIEAAEDETRGDNGQDGDTIVDVVSYILGDIFHMRDRPKVPMRHAFKKAYHVSLRDAFLIMDSDILQDVETVLRRKGLTDDDIAQKKLFQFDYFRLRVPRVCPPPSILHARVKAVFDFYKDRLDPDTEQPGLNEAARGKADGVLRDISKGLVSDPPGHQFYTPKLDLDGNVKKDADGLVLWHCSRGSNIPEAVSIRPRFGSHVDTG
jgi:hypothetical protein